MNLLNLDEGFNDLGHFLFKFICKASMGLNSKSLQFHFGYVNEGAFSCMVII